MSTPFIPGFLNTLTRSFETHGHLTPCLSPYDEKTETTKEGHKKDPGGRNRNSTLLLLCLTEWQQFSFLTFLNLFCLITYRSYYVPWITYEWFTINNMKYTVYLYCLFNRLTVCLHRRKEDECFPILLDVPSRKFIGNWFWVPKIIIQTKVNLSSLWEGCDRNGREKSSFSLSI